MMHFIIGLSLAMLVLLGGLFLLAYTKKEGLGMMTKIASYVAVLFGTVVFVGGLICMCTCGGGCHRGGHEKMEMRMHCMGNSCKGKSMKCEGDMKCHEKTIIKHIETDGKMVCSKSDSGCCKDGACKNADKDCCKGGKEKVIETTTVVKTK